jgi:isopentenyl diphosphate isomerase/L-lactate dehydrogenase-like FMN-dependent dehydrogenase
MSNQSGEAKAYGRERQSQVYRAGLQGQHPLLPVAPEALEQEVSKRLSPEVWGYLAGMDDTMQANRRAFQRWRILPRMLRDVSHRDFHIQMFGVDFPTPILLAPIGIQSIIHPQAEIATAFATAPLGIPFILSTNSSKSIEEVAEALGSAPRWFQLYWNKNTDLNISFVQRAEQAGYSAIVVTLDTSMPGWRYHDVQNAYLPFLQGEGLANYFSDPVFCQTLSQPPAENPFAAIRRFTETFGQPALTWQHLTSLRASTTLPIILKGILHPDDALRALSCGMDGIIVSNHGGRQIEGACAALDALPAVVAVVQDKVPVLFDSGIRRASDIIKALALGARAILLGRPYIWGLALAGEEGVREVLLNLLADLDLTLALSGHSALSHLDRSVLVRDDVLA